MRASSKPIIKLTLLGVLFFEAIAFADGNCGLYEVNGRIEKNSKRYSILLASGTKSQMAFVLPFSEEMKVLPYVNLPVKALVVLAKPIKGDSTEIKTLESVQSRVPDPLHPSLDSNYKQIKSTLCK